MAIGLPEDKLKTLIVNSLPEHCIPGNEWLGEAIATAVAKAIVANTDKLKDDVEDMLAMHSLLLKGEIEAMIQEWG